MTCFDICPIKALITRFISTGNKMATSKKKSRVGAPELESEIDSVKDGKNGLTFEEEEAEHMEEGADSSTDDESDTDSEEMDIEEARILFLIVIN